MKGYLEKCINHLRFSGLKEEEYREIEPEILETDKRSLEMALACLLLMFSGLFLGSYFSEMMAPNRFAYALLWVGILLVYLLCRVFKKSRKKFIVPVWYFAMTLMVGYAIILNTVIRNDISATTFCIILIVAPLLVLDKPWRVLLYFAVVVCIFIPIDFHQKAYHLAFSDMVNALCCFFLGSVIHFNILKTKFREILQRHYIEKQRDTDQLTGCLTKTAFENRIKKIMEEGVDSGVLLVMDVDHFKSINDTYGHIYGDMVLHIVGENIRGLFQETALCGRFGGDEFVIFVSENYNKKNFTEQLSRLVEQIHGIRTPDQKIKVTSSMGLARYPDNGRQYKELFENADAALYTAKKLGRDRYVFCQEV